MIPTSSVTTTASGANDALQAIVKAHAGKGKGHWASMFSSTLKNVKASLDSAVSATAQTAKSDALGQITALLQNGTPMTTIVDQIAGSVGSSAASLLSNTYAQGDVSRLQSSITQSIANALAPPSNAPPGTAAQEAAALAARLRNVVTTLARDAQSATGQQNELSGNLLDANSAKETPAQMQQQSNGTSDTLDVGKLVDSLLSSAATSLSAAGNGSSATQSAGASSSMTSILSSLAGFTPGTALAASAVSTASQLAASNDANSAQTQTQAAVQPQQATSSLTMSNAPDLLARMLVRAAGADAQLNTASAAESAAASSGSDAAAVTSAAGSTAASIPSLTPATIAAKFAALLAEATPGGIAAAGSSGNAGTSTTGNSSHSYDDGTSQNGPFSNAAAPIAAMAPTSDAQAQNAAQTGGGTSAQIDANKLIEQMIDGMQMRTLAQGASEIRLQLQPENLGQVSMRLTVSGNQVTANVVAQNADVGNALLANHRELARSLASSGLSLAGFSVDVSGGDAGKDQSKGQNAGFGRRYVVHELNGSSATDEATASTSNGPTLLPGSRLELFNSLA
jgi:flagellar hook-length control protein FliK